MNRNLFIVLLFVSVTFVACDKTSNKRDVLVEKKIISQNEYLIICKGYPKEGIDNKIQKVALAKEAALLNAQVLAGNYLKPEVDVIRNGLVKKYTIYDDYVVIEYVVQYKNIKKYIK